MVKRKLFLNSKSNRNESDSNSDCETDNCGSLKKSKFLPPWTSSNGKAAQESELDAKSSQEQEEVTTSSEREEQQQDDDFSL